jgi:flagellar hook assembly protein FlgD
MKSAAMKKTLTAYAKKNTTFTAAKAFKITNAKGSLSYAKSSGDKKITVAKNGKVTVKKGLKKGKYTVKIKVTAKGNSKYKSKYATVTSKIVVK